jgi:hypothetical protein
VTHYIEGGRCPDGVEMVQVSLGSGGVVISYYTDSDGNCGVVLREMTEPIPPGESVKPGDRRFGERAVVIRCNLLSSALLLKKQVDRLVDALSSPSEPSGKEVA